MDSFELNKLLGGLLGAAFVVFTIGIVSDSIFASPTPENAGYAIEVAEEEGGGGGPAVPEIEPIAVRLASADAGAGENVYKKCAACHTVDNGGANKVGPNLWDIVNRPIATHEGFSYSGAMQEFAQDGTVVWDYQHLDDFLASPKGLVKGTAMGFAGIKKPDERADLIAYLHTLSDSPAPLPEVPTEEEAAQADDATAGDQPAAETDAAPADDAAESGGEAEKPAAETDAEPAAEQEAAPADDAADTGEEAEKPAAE
ncbi:MULTISPECIES: c-type cytochrome [Nitratireductor]|uniref:c-type cytochrome n=1 Tax=Nitratireductor TaxID=245876 RepID=UPI000D0CC403|nr:MULTISPECIES: cytochrome c family protein [Nitratireductor]PSM16640.1 cytochrome c family protein [Nitratireductor sp. StC3]